MSEKLGRVQVIGEAITYSRRFSGSWFVVHAGRSSVEPASVSQDLLMLREQARAWLDNAEHSALVTRLLGENDGLRSRLAALELHNQNMAAAIEELQRQRQPAPLQFPGQVDPAPRQPWQNAPALAAEPDPFAAFARMPPIARRGAGAAPGEGAPPEPPLAA